MATITRDGAAAPRLDGELLAEYVRAGSPESFGVIVDRFAPAVYQTCFRILRDPHSAEDATQLVFMGLARKRFELDGVVLAGWLYHAAQRAALELRRKSTRLLAREREAARRRALAPGAAPSHPGSEELQRAMLGLPVRQRDALILRYVLGLSYEAAAAEMGCPVRTFHSRLANALAKLRMRLRDRAALRSAALSGLLALDPCPPLSPAFAARLKALCSLQEVRSTGRLWHHSAGAAKGAVLLSAAACALLCGAWALPPGQTASVRSGGPRGEAGGGLPRLIFYENFEAELKGWRFSNARAERHPSDGHPSCRWALRAAPLDAGKGALAQVATPPLPRSFFVDVDIKLVSGPWASKGSFGLNIPLGSVDPKAARVRSRKFDPLAARGRRGQWQKFRVQIRDLKGTGGENLMEMKAFVDGYLIEESIFRGVVESGLDFEFIGVEQVLTHIRVYEGLAEPEDGP